MIDLVGKYTSAKIFTETNKLNNIKNYTIL